MAESSEPILASDAGVMALCHQPEPLQQQWITLPWRKQDESLAIAQVDKSNQPSLFQFVHGLFSGNAPADATISRVVAVSNVLATKSLEMSLHVLGRGRANPFLEKDNPVDNADWAAGIDRLKGYFVPGAAVGKANMAFAWHGCSADAAEAICSHGPRPLRTTDGGFFTGHSYFAMESAYALRYSALSRGLTPQGEHALILFAVCVGNAYVVSLAGDYPNEKYPGFSKYYAADPKCSIAMPPRYDTMFVPTKYYGSVDPTSGRALDYDVDYQACPDSRAQGHELVLDWRQVAPIAIVYVKVKNVLNLLVPPNPASTVFSAASTLVVPSTSPTIIGPASILTSTPEARQPVASPDSPSAQDVDRVATQLCDLKKYRYGETANALVALPMEKTAKYADAALWVLAQANISNRASAVGIWAMGRTIPNTTTEKVNVLGASHTQQDCYLEALRRDPTFSYAWGHVGFTIPSGRSLAINGRPYTALQCYTEAVERDSSYANGWGLIGFTLGKRDMVAIGGVSYTQRQCFEMALKRDSGNGDWWINLGNALGDSESVFLNGTTYSKLQCYLQSVRAAPRNPFSWNSVGVALDTTGTVTIDGKTCNKSQCFVESLRCKPSFHHAWLNLGKLLSKDPNDSVSVNNAAFTQVGCYMEALRYEAAEKSPATVADADVAAIISQLKEITKHRYGALGNVATKSGETLPYDLAALWVLRHADEKATHARAVGIWALGRSILSGKDYVLDQMKFSEVPCFTEAVLRDPSFAYAWGNLGFALNSGHVYVAVKDKRYSQQDCYIEALGLDPTYSRIWCLLGDEMTKQQLVAINGRSYSKRDCLVQAATHNADDNFAWNSLGTELEVRDCVTIKTVSYTKAACYVESLRIDPRESRIWELLAGCLGPNEEILVSRTMCSKRACLAEALRLDSGNRSAQRELDALNGTHKLQTTSASTVPRTSSQSSAEPIATGKTKKECAVA